VIYLLIIILVYVFQERLVYRPKKELHHTPSSVGLSFQQFKTILKDGNRVHGWFIPADLSTITILYCHGNAGNISDRLDTIQFLNRLGVNVAIFDYRGYGKSEGKTTEEGTYEDASAVRRFLIEEMGISEENLVIMGRSLGGPIAARLAALSNPAALILESTFTSAVDLGSDMYPWLPVEWLLKFEYETQRYLKQVEAPTFMAHSVDDDVVPYQHGQNLYAMINHSKIFVDLIGSHAEGFKETGTEYRESLQKFLEEHTPYRKNITEKSLD